MNPKILQEPAVRYFLEVVRCGSISEAAGRLNVASSAISRQIARLEASLDTLLFERRARGMRPSAAGELLAAYALRVQLDSDRVGNEIMALKGLGRGHVRVASTSGFAHEFLPQVFANFRQIYPGIQFQLNVDNASTVARRLREGQADIGLTFSQIPEADITVQAKIPAPIYAVMANDHELAGKRHVLLNQLALFPLSLPQRGILLRDLFDVCCSRQGILVEPAFSGNSMSAMLGFALHGGGVALSSMLPVRHLVQSGQLKAVPLRERDLLHALSIAVCTLSGRLLPEAAKVFLNFVQNALTEASVDDANNADSATTSSKV